MKICILSAVNIKHMSLITLYTEFFKEHGIKFDIVYMDKYGEEEEFPAEHIYRYENKVEHSLPRWVKALQYFKFRGYATKILEKNKYDFIIVWNDVAIFMFADYLARKWKGKYCLNVRDYCGEKKKWVFNRFKQVIKKSAFTAISSDGFCRSMTISVYIALITRCLKILSRAENCKRRINRFGYRLWATCAFLT